MRRFYRAIVLSFLSVLLISSVALAAWTFKFPTIVQDTSGANRTYYPVDLGYNAATLLSSGKIAANGLNTNMQVGGTDVAYMMDTTRVMAVVPTLGADAMATVDLYTGYTPNQTSFDVVVGEGGYITTGDDDDIELGNSFDLQVSGYIDTSAGADKNVVNKDGAVVLYADSGTINADISLYGSGRPYWSSLLEIFCYSCATPLGTVNGANQTNVKYSWDGTYHYFYFEDSYAPYDEDYNDFVFRCEVDGATLHVHLLSSDTTCDADLYWSNVLEATGLASEVGTTWDVTIPTEYNSSESVYGNNIEGMYFIASRETINSAQFRLYRVGTPGTITANIYAASGGLPTGASLASGTLDGDSLTTDVGGVLYTISFTANTLTIGNYYAVTLEVASGDAANYVVWLSYDNSLGWLTDYTDRQKVTITGSTDGALTDYQV
ncbi:MAG: hypothetical protein WC554_10170, partial [Clostridia bacterium]